MFRPGFCIRVPYLIALDQIAREALDQAVSEKTPASLFWILSLSVHERVLAFSLSHVLMDSFIDDGFDELMYACLFPSCPFLYLGHAIRELVYQALLPTSMLFYIAKRCLGVIS